jgi:tetratricopeptide (TPR) repeat protein
MTGGVTQETPAMRFFLARLILASLLMTRLAGAQSNAPAPHPSSPVRESGSRSGFAATRASETPSVSSASAVEPQLIERLDSRYEKMLREARTKADDRFRDYMSYVLAAATVVLTALALIFVALVVLGFREIRKLKRERRKVVKLRRDLDEHIVVHIKHSIEKSVERTAFENLPPLGDPTQLAGTHVSVPPEIRLPYEETDAMVVLGDKLDALGDADKATGYFNRLAAYWWKAGDWARGAARSKRAIEISPTSAMAYVVYATGLMDRSSQTTDLPTKLQLLADAERHLQTARTLTPENRAVFLRKLGWIYDERQDFPRAIEYYRRALRERLDPPTRARYRYDLACTLCKAGYLQEALDELRHIIALNDNWKLASRDPDFKNLRNSWAGAEFEALIEEGRRGISPAD